MDAKQLAAEFGVRDVVDFAEEGGLVKALVSQDGMRGEMFLQGATVTRWQPAGAALCASILQIARASRRSNL